MKHRGYTKSNFNAGLRKKHKNLPLKDQIEMKAHLETEVIRKNYFRRELRVSRKPIK